jgi:phosphoribosylformimino-5-aminoimidazole carboxamide ribotide isomerase
MDIVPVIDIRGGTVVHARRGERASYAPLQSALVEGSEPLAVLHALLGAVAAAGSPATAIYVADLDAIVSGQPQWPLLELLRSASLAPLWLDAGFDSAAAALDAARRGFVPVVGSESLRNLDGLPAPAYLTADAWVLSLDRDASGPRDPAGISQRPDLWPQRVIAMDLTRVGSAAGGVGAWLEACMAMSADRTWIAAGGVRSRSDLRALQAAGASAALVATALHNGELNG